jgi:hypothetical protein
LALLWTGAALSLPALAQSEAALKSAFEGKRVVVKIEMPATKDGIDIALGSASPIDYRAYSTRIKRFGTALRPGDSVLITGIKVKENWIEFQLGGGGYGTVTDETADVPAIPTAKTRREKNLESDIKSETDPRRRKRMKEELDDLRSDRMRNDRLAQATAAQATEIRRDRIREKALDSGSRFNLRYPQGQLRTSIPSPDAIVQALSEWVYFGTLDPRSGS